MCEACDIGGARGTCTAVPAGEDPRNECAPEAPAICGRDGVCDGAGACRRHPQGTVCAPARCAGTTLTEASTCDGAGRCVPGTMSSCGGFQCDSGGLGCRASCAGATDCIAGVSCVNGSCGTIEPLGAACTEGTQCQPGKCQQGVCCATDCTGTCRSCALAGSLGTCTVVPAGMDPLSQCTDRGAASCDRDGQCDGAGAAASTRRAPPAPRGAAAAARPRPPGRATAQACARGRRPRAAIRSGATTATAGASASATSTARPARPAAPASRRVLRGFADRNFGASRLTRTDPVIAFDWAGSPGDNVPVDDFSVRWTGKVTARFSETYTFIVRVDDGVRLWVGNLSTPIVESWKDEGPTEYTGTVTLAAGQATDIKIEYYEAYSGAVMQLDWQSPSQPRETVPASALTPP